MHLFASVFERAHQEELNAEKIIIIVSEVLPML